MDQNIVDADFEDTGRRKPWLAAYVAVALLATVLGGAWGCTTYFRATAPAPAVCELRGTMASRGGPVVNVYECPGGAVLMQPTLAPPTLPVPVTERAAE